MYGSKDWWSDGPAWLQASKWRCSRNHDAQYAASKLGLAEVCQNLSREKPHQGIGQKSFSDQCLDAVFRARGFDKLQPIRVWTLRIARHDFDYISISKLVAKRDHHSTNPCSRTMVPYFRMDGVGKVYGCRASRKHTHITLGCEASHPRVMCVCFREARHP